MKAAKVILLVMLISFAGNINAQRLVFVFGHAEYATAVGDLKNINDKGVGAEAGLGLGLNKTFFIGTIGTTWLSSANNNPLANSTGTLRYTPIKLGIRRYVFRKNVFLKADAGLAKMKYAKASGGSSNFTSSFGAGLKFTGFEVTGDFTTVSGGYGSWLSLKAGFTIGI
jgi:hypothetical protein